MENKCKACGKTYKVPPSLENKYKNYCSAECRKSARVSKKCEACGVAFHIKPSRADRTRFCSSKCRKTALAAPTIDKECPNCGALFTSVASSHETDDGTRIFCSKKCADESKNKKIDRVCANCGQPYQLSRSADIQRKNGVCCSKKCATEFYRGSASPAFRSGIHVNTERNERYVFFPRQGKSGKYYGEHRLVSSKAIGRILEQHEPVIHINGDRSDNRPENLFICGSNSECQRRRMGSLPWPKKSNLGTYEKSNAELTGGASRRPG